MISEWYREPISKLEKTLRVPLLIREAVLLFLNRVVWIWLAWGVGLEILFDSLILAIFLGFLLAFITEMFLVRRWLLEKIIPQQLKNFEIVKSQYERLDGMTVKDLVKTIEKSVRLSSWGIVNITYAAPQSWGWEIIFRALYPLLVKPCEISYSDLLVGFQNKTIESDQLMWKAVNENVPEVHRKIINQYLEEFGS